MIIAGSLLTYVLQLKSATQQSMPFAQLLGTFYATYLKGLYDI